MAKNASHTDERPFQDKLVEYLENEYGKENVETQKYLTDIDRYEESTVRYCDIYVKGPFVNFAIETESSFESVWKGKTQVEIYAKLLDGCVPVLAVQEGHIEEPEASIIREDIQLLEFDLPED